MNLARWKKPALAVCAVALATVSLAARPPAQELQIDVVVSGLATIWAIDFAPDGRMFLTERGGHIRTVRDGNLDPEPWATLDVVEVAESGLLGLALDPDFAANGYVYV